MEAVSLNLEQQEQELVPLDHLSLRQTRTEVRFPMTCCCCNLDSVERLRMAREN